jgi:hypothetical protein
VGIRLFKQEGDTLVPVDVGTAEEAAELYQNRQAGFKPGTSVRVIHNDELYTMPATTNGLDKILSQGGRFATTEEVEAYDALEEARHTPAVDPVSVAKTAGGLAASAAFGLPLAGAAMIAGDVAQADTIGGAAEAYAKGKTAQLTGVSQMLTGGQPVIEHLAAAADETLGTGATEFIREAQEGSPALHTMGQAAGGAAGLFGTAGAGIEAAIATKVAPGLIGRTITRAGVGALEGGLVGAGEAQKEFIQNNKEITSEVLFSRFGTGAKWGAAGNAILGGAFDGGGAAAGMVNRKTKEVFSKVRRQLATKTAGSDAFSLSQANAEKLARVTAVNNPGTNEKTVAELLTSHEARKRALTADEDIASKTTAFKNRMDAEYGDDQVLQDIGKATVTKKLRNAVDRDADLVAARSEIDQILGRRGTRDIMDVVDVAEDGTPIMGIKEKGLPEIRSGMFADVEDMRTLRTRKPLTKEGVPDEGDLEVTTGRSLVNRLNKLQSNARIRVDRAVEKNSPNKVYHELDSLKRELYTEILRAERAAGGPSGPSVSAIDPDELASLRRTHGSIREFLEDEAVWGREMTQAQTDQNRAWHRYANVAKLYDKNFRMEAIPGVGGKKARQHNPKKVARILAGLDSDEEILMSQVFHEHMKAREQVLAMTAKHNDLKPELAKFAKEHPIRNKKLLADMAEMAETQRLGRNFKALKSESGLLPTIIGGTIGSVGGMPGSLVGAGVAQAMNPKNLIKMQVTAQEALDYFGPKLQKAAKGVSGRAKGARPKKPTKKPFMSFASRAALLTAYKSSVKETQDAGSGPNDHFNTLAPGLGSHFSAQQDGAASFLNSKLPVDPTSQGMFSPIKDTPVSDWEMAKFIRYARAVNRPDAVLDAIADGTVTHEEVEALRAVFPKMYSEVRDQIMEDLLDLSKPPPYDSRVEIGLLFELPTDESIDPTFMVRQQSVTKTTTTEQGGQSQSVSQTATTGAPDFSGAAQTKSQRLSAR